MPVSERELDSIRAEQEKYMPNRVTIRREDPVAPDVEERYDLATNVKARITAGFGTFRDVSDSFRGVTAYTVTVPYNSDIRPGDQVIDEQANVYRVLHTKNYGSYKTAVNCLTELIH